MQVIYCCCCARQFCSHTDTNVAPCLFVRTPSACFRKMKSGGGSSGRKPMRLGVSSGGGGGGSGGQVCPDCAHKHGMQLQKMGFSLSNFC
jgi:hypothetical protein